MIIIRQKEFTSKAFKAIKRAKILEEIGTHENGGGFLGHLKETAKRYKRHKNIVAEQAVNLDRKLMKKGIEKSTNELSEAAAVSTHRQLARGGYAKSDVVPLSKPGKKGYTKNSKDGELISSYKQMKKINPKSASDIVNYKKAKLSTKQKRT